MKPIKNQYFCVRSQRPKMVFATKEQASNFMLFNNEEMKAEGKKVPIRSYWCSACGAWHLTSKEQGERPTSTQRQHYINTQIWRQNQVISSDYHAAYAAYNQHLYNDAYRYCAAFIRKLKELRHYADSDLNAGYKLLYDILCKRVGILFTLFDEDFENAKKEYSHCRQIMNDLKGVEGFDEYEEAIAEYMSQAQTRLKERNALIKYNKQLACLKSRQDYISILIEKSSFDNAKREIKEQTEMLQQLSKYEIDKNLCLQVIDGLIDLGDRIKVIERTAA